MRASRDRKSLKIQDRGKQPGIEVNETLGQVKGHFGKGMRWGTLTVTLAEESSNRTRLEVESVMEWTVWAKAGDTQRLLDDFLRHVEDSTEGLDKPAEPGEARVVLSSVGPKKVPVIKAIRAANQMGVKDAKALVDDVPSQIDGLTLSGAEALALELQRMGCEATAERHEFAPTPNPAEDLANNAGPQPRREQAGSTDAMEQIRELADLRDSGALTEDEFATKKAELLDRI